MSASRLRGETAGERLGVHVHVFGLGMATVELTQDDIPARLSEPLESATVPSLRWWFLCRGVQVLSSWKKAKLIEKWVNAI